MPKIVLDSMSNIWEYIPVGIIWIIAEVQSWA
jgi:hypothetical protein